MKNNNNNNNQKYYIYLYIKSILFYRLYTKLKWKIII